MISQQITRLRLLTLFFLLVAATTCYAANDSQSYLDLRYGSPIETGTDGNEFSPGPGLNLGFQSFDEEVGVKIGIGFLSTTNRKGSANEEVIFLTPCYWEVYTRTGFDVYHFYWLLGGSWDLMKRWNSDNIDLHLSIPFGFYFPLGPETYGYYLSAKTRYILFNDLGQNKGLEIDLTFSF